MFIKFHAHLYYGESSFYAVYDAGCHVAFRLSLQVRNQIPDLRSTLLFVYRYMYVLQISAHASHGDGVSVAKVAKVAKVGKG